MSSELEAAGALATAGLVVGAIEGCEPGKTAEAACPNCGAQINGPYCSQCGQASQPHRSLVHWFSEFIHGLLNFDTKAWRTIPMVIFRPGTLTRNYVYGKRARYISPLAMFLFAIFLMFFAFSFLQSPPGLGGTPAEQRANATTELAEAREMLTEAERELAAAEAAPAPTDGTPVGLEARLARQAVALARAEVGRREGALARVDAAIAEREQREQAGEAATDETAPAPEQAPPAVSVEVAPAETPGASIETSAAENAESDDDPSFGWRDGETWQEGIRRSAENGNIQIFSGVPEWNERAREQLRNPDLALYRIQEAASKFSFLLVPISLPFMALLFLWKRRLTLYDHVVYLLYGLSFASILFSTIIATASVPWLSWMTGWLAGLGLPIHMFFHLKGAYALGWWSALWRTMFMLFFALIAFTIFVTFIIIVGLVS